MTRIHTHIRIYESIRWALALLLLVMTTANGNAAQHSGDGTQRKFALVINGDVQSDSRESHENNVNRALHLLSKTGFVELYLAVPTNYIPLPNRSIIHRDKATRDGIDRLIDMLSQRLDDEDELVVYMTGHGGESTNSQNRHEAGIALLSHEMYAFSDLAERLRSVRYGHRTIMIDTCMAGGGISHFADDNHKTTGITLGAVGENVFCQRLSPFFWESDESKIADLNHDGKIDLNERFSYMLDQAAALKGLKTHPQILPAQQSYTLSGEAVAAPFAAEVTELEQPERLDGMLAELRPGQLAVVEYSTDWCGVCIGSMRNGVRVNGYDARFNELAKQAAGQFLFIRLKGKNGSEERWPVRHRVRGYPTVRLFNHLGQQVEVRKVDSPLSDVATVALYRPETIVAASFKRLRELGHSESDEYHRNHALSTLSHLGAIEHVASTPELNRLLLDVAASSTYKASERQHAVEAWRALNPSDNAFVSQSPLIGGLVAEALADRDEEHAVAARMLLKFLPLELLKNLDEQTYQNMLALWTKLLEESTGNTHLLAAQGLTTLMYHKMLNVREEVQQLLEGHETQVGAIMFLGALFRKETVPELLELTIEFSRNQELSQTNRRAIQYYINSALIVFPSQYYELSEQSEHKKLHASIKKHLSEMERQLAASNAAARASASTTEDAENEPSDIPNAEHAILSWRTAEREHGVSEPMFRTVNYKQDWGLLRDWIPKSAKHRSSRRWLWGPVATLGAYAMEERYHPRGTLGIRLASSTSNGVPPLFARHGFIGELGIQTERGPLVLPSQSDPLREDKTWVGGYLALGGYVEMASALLVKGHPMIAHWILLAASAKITGLGTTADVPNDAQMDERRRVGVWSLSGVLNVGPLHVSTVIRQKPVQLGASYVVDLPISESRTGVNTPSLRLDSEPPIPERKVGHAIQLVANLGF